MLSLACAIALAAPPPTIDATIDASYGRLEAFYQDLHRHPELSLKEKRTAEKVAAEFRAVGLETMANVGGGVVGLMRNGDGPVTLVRAELDALPLQETTGLKYASEVPNVMHACGHDFNLAAIIGAAKVMHEIKSQWRGTLVVVAQPGEEVVKGAQQMIDAHFFEKVPHPDQCVAVHSQGRVEAGKVAVISGPTHAAMDSIDLVFRGKSTHGGAPHNGIDPITLAAEYIIKIQTMRGRELDPLEPVLIGVGSIHGGTKHNIVPDEVKVQLQVRSYSEAMRAKALKRALEIAQGMARTAGAPPPTFTIVESSPVSVNDPKLAERFRGAVGNALGPDIIAADAQRTMISEDFIRFATQAKVPSLSVWVGAQSAADTSIVNHSAKYAPDFKRLIPTAVKALVAGLLDLHGKA